MFHAQDALTVSRVTSISRRSVRRSLLHPSIAASTFGGDIGSSVSRLPVARSIAFAIAAIGGQMLTSATPFAPYGWFGIGHLHHHRSIIGRSEATGMR